MKITIWTAIALLGIATGCAGPRAWAFTKGTYEDPKTIALLNDRFLDLSKQIETMNTATNERIDVTNERIDTLSKTLSKQIETMNTATNERIDATNERIDVANERIDSLGKQIETMNERIDATNERIDTLSKTLSKQIDDNHQSTLKTMNERINTLSNTLSKQIDANHQSTLKLIETINDATNKRIDTLNSWWIVLLGGIVGWIVFIATQAIHNREKTETTKTSAHGPEIAHEV